MMADGRKAVNSSKVWTTLVTNLDYLPGLLMLEYSLRKHRSAYPLVVLYTDTFPPSGLAALSSRDIAHQKIPYLLPSGPSRDYSNDPRFYDCWSKLTPFSLTQYERVVQLDSDMLVMQNMDELMTMSLDDGPTAAAGGNESKRVFAAGHACVCNPLKKAHYPKDWIPANCAFTSQHSDPETAQIQGADPAVGPLGYMNGGLQVVNPSAEIFAQIVRYMNSHALDLEFADQSLLTELYRGRWVPLPYVYNALKTMRWKGVHSEIWRDSEVKNVHYILTPKPWEELDADGNSTSADETHRWWAEINKERKSDERAKSITEDGF